MKRQNIPKMMENDWMRSPIPSFSPYSFDVKPTYGNPMYELDIDGLGDHGERNHPIPKFTPTTGYYYRYGGYGAIGKLPKIKLPKIKIKRPKVVKKVSTAVKKITKIPSELSKQRASALKKASALAKQRASALKKASAIVKQRSATLAKQRSSSLKKASSISKRRSSVPKPKVTPAKLVKPRQKPGRPRPKPVSGRPRPRPTSGVKDVTGGLILSPNDRRTLVGAGILMVLGYMIMDTIKEKAKQEKHYYRAYHEQH